jgi:hypothetical protein
MVPNALWYCIYVIRCLGTFMLRGMLIAVCNSTIVLDADLLLVKNLFFRVDPVINSFVFI